MKTLKLTIEYNGSRFFGWQKQDGKRTVQGVLEDAFLKLTGFLHNVEGSGRTDRKVHAIAQVASVQTECNVPIKNFKRAINNLLPEDVVVKSVKIVPNDFHARFSAKRKTYKYMVQVGGVRSAIKNDLLAYYPFDVDLNKMLQGASLLIGKHNFKGFCSAKTAATNFDREIFDLTISKRGRIFIFEVTGDGFLYNMVRIIVGTLLDLGRNKLTLDDIKLALNSGERKYAGKTMSPCGLYLKEVKYL